VSRVLVCGGGLAGLSAGVSALEAGAQVTLIEKAPEVGGTTRLSGGLLWTFADYEEARRLVPNGDPALQWLVYDTLDEAGAWLSGMGVALGAKERVLGHGSGRSVDPNVMIDTLAHRLSALGGRIRVDTGLESLATRDGAVIGVHDDRGALIEADAVVLATGGFQGNQELLSRYVVRDAANLALRANYWSTGDGFIAATHAGAAASPGLATFYGHALAAPPARFGKHQFREASAYHGALSVALNLDGERFADETAGTGEEALNQRLAQQRDCRGVYIVDASALEVEAIQGRGAVTRTILARINGLGGVVIEAATLESLCEKLCDVGIPPNRALATLRKFNAAIRDGDDLVPPRLQRRIPLERPPFAAIVVQAGITFTMGGLRIDERTRVLRRARSTSPFAPVPVERAFGEPSDEGIQIGMDYREAPIRGLFAAGNDAGNMSHGGYMGGLACALTTGRVAGAQAAQRVTR
jgi:succinate dehydrogenase/fumarate reductase flavoprotein subunit